MPYVLQPSHVFYISLSSSVAITHNQLSIKLYVLGLKQSERSNFFLFFFAEQATGDLKQSEATTFCVDVLPYNTIFLVLKCGSV
jgi:hypothetical protein